jgi:hypothetical protein
MATTDAQLVHHWLRLKNTDRIPSKNALTRKIKNLKIWDWRWMKWGQGWHRGKKAQTPGNLDFYNTIFDKDGMPLFEEVDRAKLKALQNYYRRHPDRIPPVDEHALVTTHNPLVKLHNTRRNNFAKGRQSKVHDFLPVASVVNPMIRARQSKVHNFVPGTKKSERTGGRRHTRRA